MFLQKKNYIDFIYVALNYNSLTKKTNGERIYSQIENELGLAFLNNMLLK